MNKLIKYTSPSGIEVSIDTIDRTISCEDESKNKRVYSYHDLLNDSKENLNIGIRLSPIYVCFQSERNNMDMIKIDGKGVVYYQDDIREELIEILKTKSLMETINDFLMNDYLVYLQYIDTNKFTGYLISYVSGNGEIFQSIGSDNFLSMKMVEVSLQDSTAHATIISSGLMDITYEYDEFGNIIRKPLSLRNCYKMSKHPNLKKYEYLIPREDYMNIRRMTESVRKINNTIISIYNEYEGDYDTIRNKLIKLGYSPFVKYYQMDCGYVINQVDRILSDSVDELAFMLRATNVELEGIAYE